MRFISLLVFIFIFIGCTANLNNKIVGKRRLSTGNCVYDTEYSYNSFIAPCDCFEIGDIPIEKIIRDKK